MICCKVLHLRLSWQFPTCVSVQGWGGKGFPAWLWLLRFEVDEDPFFVVFPAEPDIVELDDEL